MPWTVLLQSPWLAASVSGLLVATASFVLLLQAVQMLPEPKTLEQQRLERLRLRGHGTSAAAVPTRAQLLDKDHWVERLKPLAIKLYGSSDEFLQQIALLLSRAGQPCHAEAIMTFLGQRLFSALVVGGGFFLGLLPLPIPFFLKATALVMGLYAGGLLPMMRLRGLARQRGEEIQRTLPDVLDLMVVCVQAGLVLDATLKRVSTECQLVAPVLSLELHRLGRELNAGLPRAEAFQQLGERNGVDELKSLCALIVQSDRMGVGIAQALKVFSEDLRTRRRQRAEELASKASVKMTVPLVFFVFPPLMIILMGPMAIEIVKVFGGGSMTAGP